MLFPVLLFIITVILLMVFLIGQHNERYWNSRGVKFYHKNKVFGVFWDFFTTNGALFEIFGNVYEKYRNEPAVGLGAGVTPTLFVLDPKNVQYIFKEDFDSFNHRGVDVHEEDKLADNIIFMKGPRWKLVRESMSPLFTPTKLKNMYYIMDKSAQDFVLYLKENPTIWRGGCFETLMTFCNAAFCATIFGINSESIFNSPLLKLVEKISAPNLVTDIKLSIMSISPRLAKLLGIRLFKEYEDYLINAITKVIQNREKENVKRHDFVDVCISILKNGVMKDPVTGYEVEPTYTLFTAQAFFFLFAGVEPTAATIFITFVELGRNPDVLKTIHEEIDEAFEKNGNKLSYDIISEMAYVNKVLAEALRKYPPVGFTSRKCIKDTVLPVGNIKVDKGTSIFTPTHAIHNDSAFYPEPNQFDPERFEKCCKLSDEYYRPFGTGKRMCIGAKYSKLQIAAGVVHFLRHFTLCTKELGPLKFKNHITNVRPINYDVEFVLRNN